MTTATVVNNAVEYFKSKLEFETSPWGLKAELEKNSNIYVLDVREADAYAKEHIAGAHNIPLSQLTQKLAVLPKNQTIVTYCWNITCFSAPKAALQLAEKGFKVQMLLGGIQEWKNAGFKVESNKA